MTSSKRSSRRQRDLELIRLKKEELEKQHDAKLRIARQRLEIEKQTKLRELAIEQHEEDHRKEVAAAALEEIRLQNHHQMGLLQAKRVGPLRKKFQSRARNLFKIGSIGHTPGTWQMLQMN